MLKLYLKEEFANKGKEIISYSFLSLHPLFILNFTSKSIQHILAKVMKTFHRGGRGNARTVIWSGFVCACVQIRACARTHVHYLDPVLKPWLVPLLGKSTPPMTFLVWLSHSEPQDTLGPGTKQLGITPTPKFLQLIEINQS